MKKAAEDGNLYAKAELNKKIVRTCGYCARQGHDRRTCKYLKRDIERLASCNLEIRKRIQKKAQDLNFDIERRQSIKEDLDNYDLEILHDMVDGNTIMQGLADMAEFEEITKKEFGNYKRAFKSLIKKLNKIGEGHESYPIKDNWMLYY